MKMSVHNLRARNGINPETIKKLVAIEEKISDGCFTKNTVFEATDLYSRIVEYLEYIKDPLKLYFQEKIENLFLKKAVMRAIIEEENAKGRGSKEIEILSNDFLQFSEITDLKNSAFNDAKLRPIDHKGENRIEIPQSTRNKKNLDLAMMFKVNDEIKKKQKLNIVDAEKRFSDFEESTITIKSSLDSQENNIFKKIKERRSKNLNKDFSMRSRLVMDSNTLRPSSFNLPKRNGNGEKSDYLIDKILPDDLLAQLHRKSDEYAGNMLAELNENLSELLPTEIFKEDKH